MTDGVASWYSTLTTRRSPALRLRAVATGEVIYELATSLGWALNPTARNMLAVSILSDSLGLISEGTSARSIHIIAELVESGVRLAELEDGDVYCVYYEEGAGSSIRGIRLRVDHNGVEAVRK